MRLSLKIDVRNEKTDKMGFSFSLCKKQKKAWYIYNKCDCLYQIIDFIYIQPNGSGSISMKSMVYTNLRRMLRPKKMELLI
jgi:hypothetical protein